MDSAMTAFLRPLAVLFALMPGYLHAAELPARVDTMIHDRAKGKTFSPLADDAEFLRRVTLDLAGRIPSAVEARAFLDDRSPDKRTRRIDALLAGAEYPRRMQELFHVMFVERLGERDERQQFGQRPQPDEGSQVPGEYIAAVDVAVARVRVTRRSGGQWHCL